MHTGYFALTDWWIRRRVQASEYMFKMCTCKLGDLYVHAFRYLMISCCIMGMCRNRLALRPSNGKGGGGSTPPQAQIFLPGLEETMSGDNELYHVSHIPC